MGCETWLNPSILNNEIILLTYTLYRTDQCDGNGEMMSGVKNSINSQILSCSNNCELCSIKLVPPHGPPLIIIGVYCPPNRDTLYAEELCREITDIVNSHSNSFICCTGDFNVPDINWENESVEHYSYPISINQLSDSPDVS